MFKKIRAQQLEHSTHTHTQVTPPVRRRRRRSVKEMGGISSKPEPGFPVDTSELDGDLRLPSRAEDDGEEEEVFFSAQKVTENTNAFRMKVVFPASSIPVTTVTFVRLLRASISPRARLYTRRRLQMCLVESRRFSFRKALPRVLVPLPLPLARCLM